MIRMCSDCAQDTQSEDDIRCHGCAVQHEVAIDDALEYARRFDFYEPFEPSYPGEEP